MAGAQHYIKHSNYRAVLSCAVYYAVQDGSNFLVFGWNPKMWPFKWKLLSSTFLWCCLLCCTRWLYLFESGWNPKVWPFKWKLLSSTFMWCCLLCCTRWFYLFESVVEILKCDHPNESYWAVLSCGAVYYAVMCYVLCCYYSTAASE